MPLSLGHYAVALGVAVDWLRAEFALDDGMAHAAAAVRVPYTDVNGQRVGDAHLVDWSVQSGPVITATPLGGVYGAPRVMGASEIWVLPTIVDVHRASSFGAAAVAAKPDDQTWAKLREMFDRAPNLRRVVFATVGSTREWATYIVSSAAGNDLDLHVVDVKAAAGVEPLPGLVFGEGFDDIVMQLIRTEAHSPKRYAWDSAGTWMAKTGDKGVAWQELANFSARIDCNIRRESPDEAGLHVRIVCRRGAHTVTIEVGAAEFTSKPWWLEALGGDALVYPGYLTADNLRAATQVFSEGRIEDERVLRHLGWAVVNGCRVFVHAGGLVGGQVGQVPRLGGRVALTKPIAPQTAAGGQATIAGRVGRVVIDAPSPLAGFVLPHPAVAGLTKDVQSVLTSFGAPEWCGWAVLFGAVWRSVLGPSDFVIHVFGPTGCFKSSLLCAIQQFFGVGLTRPIANWFSTANSVEQIAHLAKDVLLIVDNLVPRADSKARQSFERIVQTVGDQVARGRASASGSLRDARPARGTIVSSGEELIGGESTLGRLLCVQVKPGDVAPSHLTWVQALARGGVYASVMSSYIAWLQPRIDVIERVFRTRSAEYRKSFKEDGLHARTSGILAELYTAGRIFLVYAASIGVPYWHVKSVKKDLLLKLQELAAHQCVVTGEQRPAQRFLDLLRTALGTGAAHMLNERGETPDDPEALGWRVTVTSVETDDKIEETSTYRPSGPCVGWKAMGVFIYLDPEAAITVTARAAGELEPFAITRRALAQALHEAGLLRQTELKTRQTYTTRKMVCGVRRNVWIITCGDLLPSRSPEDQDEDEVERADFSSLLSV